MPLIAHETGLPGLTLLAPEIHEDDRGYFTELFHADRYGELGLPTSFAQYNQSGSVKNTVRGLHFQWDPPMGKLMRVVSGTAFLVAVDIRKQSPTLGQWYGVTLSADDRKLLWGPAGFARGFAVLSDYAEIAYLCTSTYHPACEGEIRWDDPAIGIDWPVDEPLLSAKDANAPRLAEWISRPEFGGFAYPD